MEDLYNAPDITDEKTKGIINILNAVGGAAYLSDIYLYAYITLLFTLLTVKYGFSPRSPGAYTQYAIILCTDLMILTAGIDLVSSQCICSIKKIQKQSDLKS